MILLSPNIPCHTVQGADSPVYQYFRAETSSGDETDHRVEGAVGTIILVLYQLKTPLHTSFSFQGTQ